MTITWTRNVYAQERNIMTITDFNVNAKSVEIEITSPLNYSAKYIIPTSRTLQVDMTDVVRLVAQQSFNVNELDADGVTLSQLARDWNTIGLINPMSLIIPESPHPDSRFIIMPPLVIYKSAFSGVSVQFEAYCTSGYDAATERIKFLPSGTIINFTNEVEIPAGTEIVEFWHLTDWKKCSYRVRELECDARYVMVRWVSGTGKTRCHTFEMTKVTTETTDEIDIETITNQYDPRKNRQEGFTLRLDGLDEYGVWYYSDIIASSKVEVTLNGSKWYQVQVTQKKVTYPDGNSGSFNKLEIPVNFRKYDTI